MGLTVVSSSNSTKSGAFAKARLVETGWNSRTRCTGISIPAVRYKMQPTCCSDSSALRTRSYCRALFRLRSYIQEQTRSLVAQSNINDRVIVLLI
jgi:hypothetical protein